jgi:hypothetical protein
MERAAAPAGTPALPHTRRHRRRRARCLAAMVPLAVVLTAAAPAPSADAVVGDLVCFVNFQLNFDPPLTATNPDADVEGDAALVGCESPNGNYPSLASATVDASGDAVSLGGVPCNLLLTASGSGRFMWNTGQVSHFDWVVNTNPLAGTVTLSAEITSGPLAGDTVTAVPVLASPNPDCALSGLSYLASALSILTFA